MQLGFRDDLLFARMGTQLPAHGGHHKVPSVTSLSIPHTVLDRFLRYVVIDTQSDPSSPTLPSTEKQKNLGRLLVKELQGLGLVRRAYGRARLRLCDHPGDISTSPCR